MSIVLPPEISERSLERAVQALREVVGSDHVLTDRDQLRELRDPFWHPAWDEYEASAVVQPASVEEVQAIVRLAREHPRSAAAGSGERAAAARPEVTPA